MSPRSTDGRGDLAEVAASRVVRGGIAGLAGTLAMTMAMRRTHTLLPAADQYPLPPRELIEESVGDVPGIAERDLTLVAHFGYGAACGALLALARPKASATEGALAGVLIWAASYYGWIPAARLLKPADEHPGSRNALMTGVHLVWGAATAYALREINRAADTVFADGPVKDAPGYPTRTMLH